MRKTLIAVLLAMMAMTGAYAQDDPYSRTVSGIQVHLGVVPADALTAQQARMHHGVPEGLGQHHVMVALIDDATGVRITDARVTAYLAGISRARSERALELMTDGGIATYGNYLSMPGRGPYEIRIEIRRAGQVAPVRVSFTYPLADR